MAVVSFPFFFLICATALHLLHCFQFMGLIHVFHFSQHSNRTGQDRQEYVRSFVLAKLGRQTLGTTTKLYLY